MRSTTIDIYRYVSVADCTLLYPRASVRMISHSHSMVLKHGNSLTQQGKFFAARSNTLRSIRQKFALLISMGNFDDPRFARFQ